MNQVPINEAPILEARSINAWYGASHIVRDVDFVVRRGETVALMGRNGMGKSTLMRSLLGLLRASSVPMHGQRAGARGRTISASRADLRAPPSAGIAYVPEGRGIFPNLSVRENLQMSARGVDDGDRHASGTAQGLDFRPRARDLPAPCRAAQRTAAGNCPAASSRC